MDREQAFHSCLLVELWLITNTLALWPRPTGYLRLLLPFLTRAPQVCLWTSISAVVTEKVHSL